MPTPKISGPARRWRALIAASVAGCAVAAATALPAAATSMRYAEDLAPAIINPLFTTTMSEARINELLFLGLYTDDQDLATSPALVQSSSLNPDRMGMSLDLRSDVFWHDGSRVTARDVVFTIEAMKDPGTTSTEAGRVEWIADARAVGDYTVELDFVREEARPEDKLYFKILPSERFSGTAVNRTDAFRNDPVGAGPYKFVSYNDDSSITFQAHTAYLDSVYIGEVIMREVSDKNYQAKLLLYESLEALIRVLPRDLAVLQNNRKVELYPYQTNSWWYVGFNQDRAPFDDDRVRRALTHMVDVESLLAPIGTGEILSGPFVKSSPFYNHKVRAASYDARTAEALLSEAGYARDGEWWSKGGEPLTVRLNAHQTLESSQEVVINLQSQLQNRGIKVEVDFLDEANWKSRVWREQDFDVILSQWSFDRNEDIREQFHSEGTRNFCNYASEEVDALLDQAQQTSDPQEKKNLLRQAHAQINQDAPMIFLWSLHSYAAINTKVSGVVVHPFYFFTFIKDWRI